MAKKILLIEDDPFLSSILGNRLKKEGYELLEAKRGTDAIKAIRESAPDLVLLDIILPGMSGFEVLEAIKSDPATARIPVIIISNLGQESDIERGKELGADDYIIKAKITIDEMVGKIRSFLG